MSATMPPSVAALPHPTIAGPAQEFRPELSAPQREERVFLLLSIFIGVISGLLVVSFRISIEELTLLLQGSAPGPHQLRLILAPTLAGIVIAILTRFVFPQVRGSGVNQTKAALYIHNGYISTRTVVGKFLLCALAIGSGFSTGPEDPSLQIGAGAASLISRKVGLSRERLRIFAPVGAAAGLAAAFNAPISAILFVIEEVIGQWTAGVLGSIVLAAVSAVVVARWFWGSEPMFRVPAISLRDPRELMAYAVLGLVGGVASLLFAKALGYLRPLVRRQTANVQMLGPAIAGFLVGCVGYFGLPQVMGAGYSGIDAAMHAQFTFKVLLLLAAFKIIATTISFSSGSPGGVFAPTLFVGAMLGAAVGAFEKHYFPGFATGSIGSYALVGMGVLFAAFLRAPLTSVFMILEVSGNYSIILPVILANTIAYLLARALQPIPIFEVFTHQDGLYLPSMEEQREESTLHFEDALLPVNLPILQGGQTLQSAREALANDEAAATAERPAPAAILIQCRDGGWYAARPAELNQLFATLDHPETAPEDAPGTEQGTTQEAPQNPSHDASQDLLETRLGPERTPLIFPDQPLSTALPFFRRWPVVPISNRATRGALEGVLSLDDVLKRYQQQ